MKKSLICALIGTVAISASVLGGNGVVSRAEGDYPSPSAESIRKEARERGENDTQKRYVGDDGEIFDDEAEDGEIYDDDSDGTGDEEIYDGGDEKATVVIDADDEGVVHINIITDDSTVVVNNYYERRIIVRRDEGKQGEGGSSSQDTSSGGSSSCGCVTQPVRFYDNNVVPAMDCVVSTPVGQGGKIIINGCLTNATLTVSKADNGEKVSAGGLASNLGARLINVVANKAPGVRFKKMQVVFYMPGVRKGDPIAVYQMNCKGSWDSLEVNEVRDDHVTVTMYRTGTLAFVRLAEQVVAQKDS